jgi:hypothetical protein
MATNRNSRLSPGIMITAVIGCLVMVALAVGALLMATRHHNELNNAETHDNIAATFQSAENEGIAASEALQQYVATGDVAFIAQSQAHTEAGVTKLSEAVGLLGSDPNGFIEKGGQMVQASGQVVALRQTGDVQSAVTLMEDLEPSFNQFIAQQDEVIADQRQAAQDSRDSAATAKDLTFWLAIASGVVGFALVIGGIIFVSRGSRRAVGAASA